MITECEHNAIEEQDTQKDHGKAIEFTHRKCLVTYARIHKEECPDNHHSSLVHNHTICGRRKLGYIYGEAMKSADADRKYKQCCLLTRKKDVIDVAVNALFPNHR